MSLDPKFEETTAFVVQGGSHVEIYLEQVFTALIKHDTIPPITESHQKIVRSVKQTRKALHHLPTISALSPAQSKRFLLLVSLTNHLEKIGEHLLNISKRVEDMRKHPVPEFLITLPYLKKEMQRLLSDILDACHHGGQPSLRGRAKKLGELQGSFLIDFFKTHKTFNAMTHILFIERNFDKIGTHLMDMTKLLCDDG